MDLRQAQPSQAHAKSTFKAAHYSLFDTHCFQIVLKLNTLDEFILWLVTFLASDSTS